VDMRCANKKHAVLTTPSTDEGVVEFRCDSRWCGAGNGVIVLHRFSTVDGRLMDTHKYRPASIGG
jgi:hypothetical protein